MLEVRFRSERVWNNLLWLGLGACYGDALLGSEVEQVVATSKTLAKIAVVSHSGSQISTV